MYTPFRLNPRIFPAVVSATVAASEAMTVLRSHALVADFIFWGASGVDCANTVAGKMAEPASPAPRVAIAPIKERRSLNPTWDLLDSSMSFLPLGSPFLVGALFCQ
jgi:hypothetical protein